MTLKTKATQEQNRERERGRQTETDRQTYRQTDIYIYIDRQTADTGIESKGQTHIQRQRQRWYHG